MTKLYYFEAKSGNALCNLLNDFASKKKLNHTTIRICVHKDEVIHYAYVWVAEHPTKSSADSMGGKRVPTFRGGA